MMDYAAFSDDALRAEWNRLISEPYDRLDWESWDALADVCRECDRRELAPWGR